MGTSERFGALALAVAGALVGLFVGAQGQPAHDQPLVPTVEVDEPQGTSMIPVHVAGWVAAPGVVWVADGALASEAVAAAGGALPGANLDQVNLAQQVREGDQLQIPGPEAASSFAEPMSDGLIDINTAESSDLQKLPGVGPVLAERIIAHRESVGRFEVVEDLLDVAGIGEATLSSMRDAIRPP